MCKMNGKLFVRFKFGLTHKPLLKQINDTLCRLKTNGILLNASILVQLRTNI